MSKENSLAAAKCRGCGTELTPANDTAAHVIPNALGGRLKPKGILCDTCNGKLDRLADNALVKAFGDWPTLMDIPRDRGAAIRRRSSTLAMAQLVRLEADGTLTRIDVQYDVETFGDSGKLNIGAGDHADGPASCCSACASSIPSSTPEPLNSMLGSSACRTTTN